MRLLRKLDPETSAYQISTLQRPTGELDADALERALGDLMQRHETLRTTFERTDGALVQQVHAHPAPSFDRHDLSALTRHDAERRTEALAHRASHAPFDLEADPLLRGSLFRLGDDEHVLLLVMHRIVADA